MAKWIQPHHKSDLAKACASRWRAEGMHPFIIQLSMFAVVLDLEHEAACLKFFDILADWSEHPDYAMFHGVTRFGQIPETPAHVPMIGVFTHDPGVNKRTESYVIGTFSSIVSSIGWGEKTLGKFTDIRAIPPDIRLTETNCIRIAYVSYSLKGSGKAFRARMALKSMLPKDLQSLVQYTRKRRRASLDTKRKDWDTGLPLHNFKTKKERFLKHDVLEFKPELWRKLATYISLDNFWDCATGKVHPDDVQNYVTHQMEMEMEYV